MSVLTLDYRPVTFKDVVGQTHIKPVLRAMVAMDDMCPALIFSGSRGTGKTTTARILAAALNCPNVSQGDACGTCPSCLAVQKVGADSVLEVDAASNSGIDEIRRIQEVCRYSHPGQWRLVLLDEAHSLSKAAWNALLKILEEPPERTVFILLTTEDDKIIETVKSRCMQFTFKRLTEGEIVGRLRGIAEAEGITVSDDVLTQVAVAARGGMRDAVMALDQCRRAGVVDMVTYRIVFGGENAAFPVLWAVLDRKVAEAYALVDAYLEAGGEVPALISDVTDLLVAALVVAAGGKRPGSEEQQKQFERIAAKVDEVMLARLLRTCWELSSRAKSDPSRQVLDFMVARFGELLGVLAGRGDVQAAERRTRGLESGEVVSLVAALAKA